MTKRKDQPAKGSADISNEIGKALMEFDEKSELNSIERRFHKSKL